MVFGVLLAIAGGVAAGAVLGNKVSESVAHASGVFDDTVTRASSTLHNAAVKHGQLVSDGLTATGSELSKSLVEAAKVLGASLTEISASVHDAASAVRELGGAHRQFAQAVAALPASLRTAFLDVIAQAENAVQQSQRQFWRNLTLLSVLLCLFFAVFSVAFFAPTERIHFFISLSQEYQRELLTAGTVGLTLGTLYFLWRLVSLSRAHSHMQILMQIAEARDELARALPPLGSIVGVPGPAVAAWGPNWLPCIGQYLDTVGEYAPLFAALGTVNGSRNSPTGVPQFRLPDLRGMFLRGWDDAGRPGGPTDRGLAERKSQPGAGAGSGPGSTQQDAFESHNHSASGVTAGSIIAMYTGPAQPPGGHVSSTTYGRGGSDPAISTLAAPHGVTVNVQANGSAETRPVNTAVRWMMRVQ